MNQMAIEQIVDELQYVLNIAMEISQAIRGNAGSRAEEEASGLLMKNCLSAYTVYQINRPRVNNGEFTALRPGAVLLDFPSVNIIVRAMYEAYVNMFYLFVAPQSDEEREFRHDRWDLHALCERKRMVSDSQHPKLVEEAQQIDKLIEKILEYAANLPKPEAQSIRDAIKNHRENGGTPNWRGQLKIPALSKIASIHESLYRKIYTYSSAYSHSEAYSIMQILSLESIEDYQEMLKSPTRLAAMFLTLTISAFASISPTVRSHVEKHPRMIELIVFYEKVKGLDWSV